MKLLRKLVVLCCLFVSTFVVGCGQEVIELRIYLHPNNGQETITITSYSKNTIKMPSNPTWADHQFDNWYYDDVTFKVPFSVADLEYNTSSELNLYANWFDLRQTTYDLDGFLVKMSGFADVYMSVEQLTSQDEAMYGQLLELYGRKVLISEKHIEFTGSALSLLGKLSYRMSGENVIFDDPTVAQAYNHITLSNGKFELGNLLTGTGYIFEYHSNDYIPPTYKINLNYDGATGNNSVASVNVEYGKPIGTLPIPEKLGYTFTGWYNPTLGFLSSNTIFNLKVDIDAVALYQANTYDIYLDYQGATGGNTKTSISLQYNTILGSLPTPNKTGHSFVGWFTLPEGQGIKVEYNTIFNFTYFSNPPKLFACWSANSYDITFNYQGGTTSTTYLKATYGQPLGALPTSSKTDNTFEGWYSDVGGKGTKYEAGTIFNNPNNITLYAKWNTKVTFDYQDATSGTATKDMIVTYNGALPTLPTPSKTGYTFGGWYSEKLGQGTKYSSGLAFTSATPITLYAKWTTTVNLNYQGATSGNSTASLTVTYNAAIGTMPNPSRTGYTFLGWYNNSSGTGSKYLSSSIYKEAGSITLYAKWQANEYTIYFDYQDDVNPTSIKVLYDSSIGDLPLPSKDGNTFGGWYTAAGGAGSRYTDGLIFRSTNSITLYAKWTTTISFDYQGATIGLAGSEMSVVYNTYFGNLPRPYKNDYSFEGWYYQDTLHTDNDVFLYHTPITLVARWVEGTDKAHFNYTINNNAITITGYTGTFENIVIPDTIDLLPVRSISSSAFASKGLTSVVIPDSVTQISIGAFYNNPLIEMTIPFVGTSLQASGVGSVFGAIFNYTSSWQQSTTTQNYNDSNSAHYYIPSTLKIVTVTSSEGLKPYSFNSCSSLASITINSNINELPTRVFSNCKNLILVNGMENVTIVNTGVFEGNINLANLNTLLPLDFVGSYAFTNCALLTDIEFSDSLPSIGTQSFRGTRLKNVVVPNSVTSIGKGSFRDTPLVSISLPFVGANRTSSGVEGVFGHIFDYQTSYASGLTQQQYNDSASGYFFIPLTLKSVSITTAEGLKPYSFYNCSMLTSLSIASGTTSLPMHVFADCTNLTVINGIENVTAVGTRAFYNNSKVTNLSDLPVIESLGSYAFTGCSNLTFIELAEGITSIGTQTFASTSLSSIILPSTLTSISSFAFQQTLLKNLTIPNSVTSIGRGAFKGAPLISITLPFIGSTPTSSGVERVFGYIFDYSSSYANGLTQQYYASDSFSYYFIPATLRSVSVTTVEGLKPYSFQNCSKLTSLSIASASTSLPVRVFSDCINLEVVNGIENITSVNTGAFYENKKLANLNSLLPLDLVGAYAFTNCALLTDIEFSDSLPSIGNQSFRGTGLSNVIVSNSVTSIGRGAFRDTPLVSITLPFIGANRTSTGLEGVFGHIFDYQTSYTPGLTEQQYSSSASAYFFIPLTLRSVSITSGLKLYSFYNCSMLTSISISDDVSIIPNYAFYNTGISSFSVSPNVVEMKNYSFASCAKLKELTILAETPPLLGTGVFNQTSLTLLVANSLLATYQGNSQYQDLNIIGY